MCNSLILQQKIPKSMSFFKILADSLNTQITLHMNDIIFLILICFYLGRLYEEKKWRAYFFQTMQFSNGQFSFPKNCKNNVPAILYQIDTELIKTQNQDYAINEVEQKNQILQDQSRSIAKIKRQLIQEFGQKSSDLRTSRKLNKEIKHSVKENFIPNNLNQQNQFLKEKIRLDGQKLQQKGKFQMFFETSKQNINFVRKIEKHQIITDYILKKGSNNCHYGQLQLIPSKKQTFPNSNSVIQIQYYQNFSNPTSLPIVQKRIIQLNQKPKIILHSFIEHGKFRKLYRNILKIGEGGFGTVYQAQNILQSKKYAIKKIILSKNLKDVEHMLNQIKILNSLSHPNVLKYNSCWLEYAQFNQHKQYQIILQSLGRQNKNQKDKGQKNQQSIFISHQSKRCLNDQQYEQSYISSKNSGFSFFKQSNSKQTTNKQIKANNKENSIALLKINQQKTAKPIIPSNINLLPLIYIQMQLCEHSLAYFIKKQQKVDRIFAFEIMEQIIQGVVYIHSNKIVHRDLKPGNILFVEHNGKITAKIGDFGLALYIGSNATGNQLAYPNIRAGTPSYIAPQLYEEKAKTLTSEELQKADVYALGVIYYQILNKFSTSHQRIEKLSLLKQGKISSLNQFKPEKKFIQDLLHKNRPKSKDIQNSTNWKRLADVITKQKTYNLSSSQQKFLQSKMFEINELKEQSDNIFKSNRQFYEEKMLIIKRNNVQSYIKRNNV